MPSGPNQILLTAQLADLDAQIAKVKDDRRFSPGQKHALVLYWRHEREKKQLEIQLQSLSREVEGCRVQHEYSKTPGAQKQWQAHQRMVSAGRALGRPNARSDAPSAKGPEEGSYQRLRQAELKYKEQQNRFDALRAKDPEFREALDALNVKVKSPRAVGSEAREWEKLTLEELRPAIEHIREAFETGAWKCSEVTKRLCYSSLHQQPTDATSLAPYKAAFARYRRIVGPVAQQQFDDLVRVGTPPSVFKAYFDAYRKGLEVEVRNQFNLILQIGLANVEVLKTHPVEWGKSHLQLMINGIPHSVEAWIREVCDEQNYSKELENTEDFEELVSWKAWRAPKLIHMRPSGNTPYDPATAWAREDQPRTQQLLEALSRGFVQFLGIDLDKIAGDAHVRLSQSKEYTQVPQSQMEGSSKSIRRTSNAPKPPTELSGRSSWTPPRPKPTQQPLNLPLKSDEWMKLAGEMARVTANGGPMNAESIEQHARRSPQSSGAGAATWDTIEISFLSDERVQIRNGTNSETRNYAEFGFADGRDGKPNQAWVTLRALAEERGIIRDAMKTGRAWPKVEKRMQEIRRVLRKHFGISADPVPYVDGTGYRACFKIGCSPSFHT